MHPFILHSNPATAIWEWLTALGWGHLLTEEAVLQGNLKINSWPRYESVEHYIKKED